MKQLTYVIIFLITIIKLQANVLTTKTVIDSVYEYLDTVPELRNVIINNVLEKVNPTDTIRFYPEEFEELKVHLKYSILPKYSNKQKIVRAVTLLDYKLNEEVKQYKTTLFSERQLSQIFKHLRNNGIYADEVKVLDSYWAASDKMLVLIGQTHGNIYSEEENKRVCEVQNEIASVYETILASGIDLIVDEGFYVREIDTRIPTKSPLIKIYNDYTKKTAYQFDSVNNTILYGFEDMKLYFQADSAVKIPLFLYTYRVKDSLLFPMTYNQLSARMHQFVETGLDDYPEHYRRSLDTIKLFNLLEEAFISKKDSVTGDDLFKLEHTLFKEANLFAINNRNYGAMDAINDIFNYTNRNAAILKIGANHLEKNNNENVRLEIEDKVITIQDLCKTQNISYIYISTRTQQQNIIVKNESLQN